jgi:hypothetical protein
VLSGSPDLGPGPGTPGWWTPLVAGIGIAPVAFALAVASGGGGHGDSFFARVFFPVTMILARKSGISWPLIILALFPFPASGPLLSFLANKKHWVPGGVGLLLFHTLLALGGLTNEVIDALGRVRVCWKPTSTDPRRRHWLPAALARGHFVGCHPGESTSQR